MAQTAVASNHPAHGTRVAPATDTAQKTQEKILMQDDTLPTPPLTTAIIPAPAPRGKIGRPTKFNLRTVRKICRAIASGLPMTFAAAQAGVCSRTFANWRHDKPDFNEAIEQAVAKAVKVRLKQIQAAGDSGDWKASAWWLEHTLPQHFARSRIEVEAIGQLEHSFVIPKETLDKIAEARKQQEEKRVDPD